MALPRPVEPELITVGPDEIVVTAESPVDTPLTTRAGDHEVTTDGPHHVARITGLEPDTEYPLEVAGVEPVDERTFVVRLEDLELEPELGGPSAKPLVDLVE